MTYYCFNEPALNTFDKEIALRLQSEGVYHLDDTISVAVKSLEEVLDEQFSSGEIPKIDFFSIDAEGLDLEVLRSNNWEKYRPDYILVEDHEAKCALFSGGKRTLINEFLLEKKYNLMAKTPRTLIFMSEYV